MSQSEAPNPEHKSNSALWLFCFGAGFLMLSWFLGVGGIMATAFTGGNAVGVAGGILALVFVSLFAIVGFFAAAIGGVWMVAQVISDQTGDKEEARYRNVER